MPGCVGLFMMDKIGGFQFVLPILIPPNAQHMAAGLRYRQATFSHILLEILVA
jgi:hypothetical protein